MKKNIELETEIEKLPELETEIETEKLPIDETSELDAILSQYTKPFEDTNESDEPENKVENKTEPIDGETKKETRGRKKGGKNKTEQKAEGETLPINNLLNGAILILIIDLVLPLIIMYVGKIVTKKTVPLDALQLTEKQKKDLIPICDEVAKRVNVNNPILLLAVTLSGIYGMNYMAYLQLNK